MKAIFIFKDDKLVGNPIGYTTIEGAKKSLVGSDDWHEQLDGYESHKKEEELTKNFPRKPTAFRRGMNWENYLIFF